MLITAQPSSNASANHGMPTESYRQPQRFNLAVVFSIALPNSKTTIGNTINNFYCFGRDFADRETFCEKSIAWNKRAAQLMIACG